MFVSLAFSQESSVTVGQLYRFPQNDIRQHSCMTLIIDQNSIFRPPPTFLIFFFVSIANWLDPVYGSKHLQIVN